LEEAASLVKKPSAPVIEVLNKVDMLPRERREAFARERPQAILLSAQTGEGMTELVDRMRACLFRDEPLVGALDADEVVQLRDLLTKAIGDREASGWVELFRPRR
jgi:50S ribosomal subunit-associated GTPase HflX